MATSSKMTDLTGNRFGRLTVLSYVGNYRWNCSCDCGATKTVAGGNLRSGSSKSCGCIAAEVLRERNTKHGHSKRSAHTRTYTIWEGLYKRCRVPTNQAYKYYGGRGIDMCDRWLSFENFLADMGECPAGLSLERVDNERSYEQDNCTWATRTEQARNRRGVKHISAFGQTMTIPEWAEKTGLSYYTIYLRLRKGSTPEEAIGRDWYSREHQSEESKSRRPK